MVAVEGHLRSSLGLLLEDLEESLGALEEEEEDLGLEAPVVALHRQDPKNEKNESRRSENEKNERIKKSRCLVTSMDSSVEPVWPVLARRCTPLCWLLDCR